MKVIVSLLLLSPLLGELLSGSSPPVRFFHPLSLIILVVFYGGGTLLIREARTRWDLQWPIIFLAVGYGILEEGLMMQSFFNPGHVDLHKLSMYGMYGGIQWPWTIMLILYHATVSTLIPIAMVDLLWPELRAKTLLRKRGLILTLAAVTIVTVLIMNFIWKQAEKSAIAYEPAAGLLLGSLAAVILLVFLARLFRGSRIEVSGVFLLPARVFAVSAFMFMAVNLILPNAMAENGVQAHTTIFLQIALTVLTGLFVIFQIFHKKTSARHLVSLILGSLFFFILLTPISEFGDTANPDPTQGMLAVGIVAFVFLIFWRRRVFRAHAEQLSEP